MMTDLFIATCSSPLDPIRWHLFQAVLARWEREENCRVHVIQWNKTVDCPRRTFFGQAWFYAEQHVESSIYLFTADDCMPTSARWIEKGLEILKEYPTAVWLGAREILDKQHPPASVWEALEPASPVLVRKGILGPVMQPHLEETWNDRNVGLWLKEIGHVTLNTNRITHNHLGMRLSTTWPDDFESGLTQIAEYS